MWSKTTTARGSQSLHQHGHVHDEDFQKMKSKWMEPEWLRNSIFVHHSQPVAYLCTKRRRTTCCVARPMDFFAFYNGFKNVCDSSEMANTSEGHNHTASIARKASFAQRQGAQATTKMLAWITKANEHPKARNNPKELQCTQKDPKFHNMCG